MILQQLNTLYDRLADDPNYAIAPHGYSLQKIAFVIIVHSDGRLHDIIDHRDHSGPKPLPVQHLRRVRPSLLIRFESLFSLGQQCIFAGLCLIPTE